MNLASTGGTRLRWLPGAMLAAGAAATAWEAKRLGLGSASQPEAGFFPFLLGAGLTVVALLLATGASRNSATTGQLGSSRRFSTSLQSFLSLSLYCALLIPLGFIIASLIFFSSQALIIERLAWLRALLRGALATAAAYGLFALLGVQLPGGLWLE